MRYQKQLSIFFFGIFFILTVGTMVVLSITQWDNTFQSEAPSIPFNSSNGPALYNDISLNQTYLNPSPSSITTNTFCQVPRYHVIWLQPKAPCNYDLYVTNIASMHFASVRAGSQLEWVVFRPDVALIFIAQVNSSESNNGSAHIEWEDSSTSIGLGNSGTGWLGINESIEIFEVVLVQNSRYDFQLELPIGADYDLYLYRLDEGQTANYDGAIAQSNQTGEQINERIMNYTAPITSNYALLVTRISGNGTFTLRFDESTTSQIPAFEILPILLGLSLGTLVLLISSKKPIKIPL